MTIRNRIVALAVLLAGLAVCGAAVAQPVIVTQKPCLWFPDDPEVDFCAFVNGSSIVTTRSIRLRAPSAGTAVVSFHGSIACDVSGTLQDRPLILVTQIVTKPDQAPDPDGPGGLLLRTILKNTTEHVNGAFHSFNLSSMRTLEIGAAGNRNFYFRIERQDELGQGVGCIVYNATFTVLFVPS
jgi:hypothetical protein